MNALYAADLHGNRYAYQNLFDLAVKQGIKIIILGGDLTPKWPVISFMSSSILPLYPKIFKPDDNQVTYYEFLQQVHRQIGKKVTHFENHFKRLGGYEFHTGKSILIADFIAQQKLLKKIFDFDFSSQIRLSDISIDTEEFELLKRMIWQLPKKYLNEVFDIDKLLISLRYYTLNKSEKRAVSALLNEMNTFYKKKTSIQTSEIKQFLDLLKFPDLVGINDNSVNFLQLCKLLLNNNPVQYWIEQSRNSHFIVKEQVNFFKYYFNKLVRKFKRALPDAQIFIIPGNDDVEECDSAINDLDKKKVIVNIDRQVHDLIPGFKIVGYPFVKDSQGRFIPDREKSEQEIEQDLINLQAQVDSQKTVFVVHSPPFMTKLDQSFNAHYGSQGVRHWLKTSSKHLVLCGHIHEAPFVQGGSWRETINQTLCLQPGGFHDTGLCAVKFEIQNPQNCEWINLNKD